MADILTYRLWVRRAKGARFTPSTHICKSDEVYFRSPYSVIGVVARLCAGKLGFDFRKKQELYLFSNKCRPALMPANTPVYWLQRAPPPSGVKAIGICILRTSAVCARRVIDVLLEVRTLYFRLIMFRLDAKYLGVSFICTLTDVHGQTFAIFNEWIAFYVLYPI